MVQFCSNTSSNIYSFCIFFFFNDTATTEIYTLSLHDALPISQRPHPRGRCQEPQHVGVAAERSEEHTSELQSHHDLVCRLLLEKKKDRPDSPRPGINGSLQSPQRPPSGNPQLLFFF